MLQYNFPTTILLGQGSLDEFVNRLKIRGHRKALVVTDTTLLEIGIVGRLTGLLEKAGVAFDIFTDTHPNPIEEDVEKGVVAYKKGKCDHIIGIGGGSPIDVAKVIKIMAANPPPLAQYDDCLGGDGRITEPMPPLYAIPTTSGTGSEAGRSGVIIMRDTGKKTIFFHPDLMPAISILEPDLTAGLPPFLTAATGIDAFVHCLEAYFANMFHPMADGIALQGMELIVRWLPTACTHGSDLEAREKMQIAATMGAVAFQKGLGMIHSMAHPLSSRNGLHHGLANALLVTESVLFLEQAALSFEQIAKIQKVRGIFEMNGFARGSLSESCRDFIEATGIEPGLIRHGVKKSDLEVLADDAFVDPCHSGNMIPVTRDDLLMVLAASLEPRK
ncbi:MAG: iron-containing alcohol dehydrogenase [Spirochaetes bacterium]|nr:iron-containing alcohol dehydrogenase [Spirochaetota bacterium]